MSGSREMQWKCFDRDGILIARPRGELSALTYRDFTDALVKYAMDQPRAVVVIVDSLRIVSQPLLSAFTSAWMRVCDWPGVPILLVAIDRIRRGLLTASAVSRFVPVFATVPSAVAAVDTPPARRRAVLDVAPTIDCGARGRRFISEVCRRWQIPQVRVPAQLVGTELLENAFYHARGGEDIRLRLELSGTTLAIAASDADPRPAVPRPPDPDKPAGHGLQQIERITLAWGCAPRWPTGKVVWGTLSTDGRFTHH